MFVNGVLQAPGRDYEVRGRELRFDKPLAKEGRLGTIRWLSIFLGIAGTYRKNDSVDVVYESGGQQTRRLRPADHSSQGRAVPPTHVAQSSTPRTRASSL